MIDESDGVLLDRNLLSDLGSIEAAMAYFDAAEFAVPPLVVEDDPPPVSAAPESAAAPGEARHGCLFFHDRDPARHRSERRRVGEGGVGTCSSRWSPYPYTQTQTPTPSKPT